MKKLLASVIIFCAIATATVYLIPSLTLGNIRDSLPSRSERYQDYTFFATSTSGYLATTNTGVLYGTTTTATSTNINTWTDSNGRIDRGYFVIQGAEDVNVLFERSDYKGLGGGNTGTTTFSVQVTDVPSPDEDDWYDYPQLQEVKTSASSDTYFTRVGETTSGASDTNDHNATSTALYSLDTQGWYAMRCIVVEETDGVHQCRATAKY